MPCKWELLLQTIMPLASGFDAYTLGTGSDAYDKLVDISPAVCSVARVALAPQPGLAPYETERPVEELRAKLESVPGIEVLVLVNRKGPFYGYYLDVRQSSGAGT